MRVFLLVLVLIFSFQSLTKADDIRDFEIEGMSIGDSLLDYYSKEEIKKYTTENYYKVDKFIVVVFFLPSFETYDSVQINYKKNDNKYKIYAIGGDIFYKNNIEECYKKKDEIINQISELLINFNKTDFGPLKQSYDTIGESYVTGTNFKSKTDGTIHVACYDWSEEIKKAQNIWDYLRLGIATKEFEIFINTVAY